MAQVYDNAFFDGIRRGARTSAAVIAPMLVERLAPSSVIDVGCAEGTFLAAFQAAGIEDIAGVDGDYVNRSEPEIPQEFFEAVDLNQPFRRDRRYDLVISLEVAEHLKPERAEGFIEDLVRLAPIVCFSAAVPGQGGTDHVNERWQDEWAVIFRSHSFEPVDLLRSEIWSDGRVEPWYAQNIMLYAKPGTIDGPVPEPLRIVHPGVFEYVAREAHRERGVRDLMSDTRTLFRRRFGG